MIAFKYEYIYIYIYLFLTPNDFLTIGYQTVSITLYCSTMTLRVHGSKDALSRKKNKTRPQQEVKNNNRIQNKFSTRKDIFPIPKYLDRMMDTSNNVDHLILYLYNWPTMFYLCFYLDRWSWRMGGIQSVDIWCYKRYRYYWIITYRNPDLSHQFYSF